MIRLRKMLKRVGDRRHPCLTPTVVLNHSPMLPFIWTALVASSLSCDERRDLKKKQYEADGEKNTGKQTGGFRRQ